MTEVIYFVLCSWSLRREVSGGRSEVLMLGSLDPLQ